MGAWGARAPHRLDRRGRQKELDRWVLNRFLRAKEGRGRLHFPVMVYDTEAPDFQIVEHCERYGVEVTEAADPAEQRWRTQNAREDHGSAIDIPSRWTDGTRSRSLVHGSMDRKATKPYAQCSALLIYLNSYDPFFLDAGELLHVCLPLPETAQVFRSVYLLAGRGLIDLGEAEILIDKEE